MRGAGSRSLPAGVQRQRLWQGVGQRPTYSSKRSAEVNSKTVRWTVLEEGKPCKRGLPLVAVTVMYVLPLQAATEADP